MFTSGMGSGFIVSSDGLVLTNAHVVGNASKATVTLTDGRIFRAEVRGSDSIIDAAVEDHFE
jgi:S1-C subfamily serine protease